jgi:hypothetical protein
MTIKDVIQRNQELETEYKKALNIITILEKKVEKLERENSKLRRQRDTLLRAIEIASEMCEEKQYDINKVIEIIKKDLEHTEK